MLSPVSSLPPEILSEIFVEIALDAHTAYVEYLKEDLFLTNKNAQPPYSWIRLSHVCRVWRSVAVSMPSLWADICIVNTSATQEFLRRSAKRNLTVTFREPVSFSSSSSMNGEIDARRESYTNILHNHIQRITSLIGPSSTIILSSEVAKAATQLRTIIMLTSDRALESSDRDALPLPFPVLEHFEYRVASLSWQPYRRLLCPTLTSLVLRPNMRSVKYWETYRVYLPTARELSRAMATMPHLEHLDVHISATREAPMQTTELKNLRYICLIGAPASVVGSLLASIIPAPDVRLRLDCTRGYDVGALRSVPEAIALALEVHDGPGSFFPCTALWIEENDSSYGLLGWRDVPKLGDFADFAHASADADVRVTCSWSANRDHLATILRPFTLHAVVHVRLGKMPWHEHGVLEGIFALCSSKSLQTLVLDGVSAPRALDLLEETSAKAVTLMNIDLKSLYPVSEVPRRSSHSDGAVDSVSPGGFRMTSAVDLAVRLERRVAEGRPIASLSIRRAMNVMATNVAVLREHVAEVEWDGLELDSLRPSGRAD